MGGRVLFVSTVSYFGGAERSLLELATSLPRVGWEPTLAAWQPGPLIDAFAKQGFTVHVLDAKGRQPGSPLGGLTRNIPGLESAAKRALWLAIALRRISRESAWLKSIVSEGGYAIVHSNCDLSIPIAYAAARQAGVPYVAHVRDQVRNWFHPRIRTCLKRADGVIAPSAFLSRRFAAVGVDVYVVPNPVEPRVFCRVLDRIETGRWRRAFAIDDAFALAVVGRLDDQKRVDVAIRAVAALAGDGVRAVLVIAGQGSPLVERRLRRLARALGVEDRVRWIGVRSDVSDWLPAMDALVMPAQGEGFGRTIVEGMLAGLPVIACSDGAAPELLADGHTGFLVPPGDASAIAGVIKNLIDAPKLRLLIGEAARREAADRFDPLICARKMAAIYDRIRGVGANEA